MRRRSRGWLAGLVLLAGGCATTGDPQQGGLFRWSEDKARGRQQDLTRRSSAAEERVDDEDRRGANLRGQYAALDTEAQRLKDELDRLDAENRTLDAQLRSLLQERRFGADKKRRLQALLTENDRWLAVAARSATSGQDTAGRRADVEKASTHNARLHRELFALLQD
jgi:predicted RNase H-like nuclease (RuvC/YqgF family)